MLSFAEIMFALVFWHALADFALQTDWLQLAKSHRTAEGAAKADFGAPVWPLALSAHAIIHAGGVAFITGSISLGVGEFFAHAAIDYMKSDERFGIYADQVLHLLCKAAWAAIAACAGLGAIGGLPAT